MVFGYNENLTIDHIDSSKGYSPDNCQWVTLSANSYNISNMNTVLSDQQLSNFVYKDNEQILIEIKKIMLEAKTTQREIANKLGIKPQGFTKMLNKKNLALKMLKKYLLLWAMI